MEAERESAGEMVGEHDMADWVGGPVSEIEGVGAADDRGVPQRDDFDGEVCKGEEPREAADACEAEATGEAEKAGKAEQAGDGESAGEADEAGDGKRGASLYKKLPHGPHGMDRAAVARNQRVRMYGAMIESVARKGYAKTSVADVISLAGVSRRAFYEHFTNKASCFVATHDVVARRTNKALLHGWESERGWENRLHAACRGMLEDIADHPKSAHLVMIEILGVGRKAYDCIRGSNALFERSLVTALVLSPDGAMCSPVAPRAIVGGVRHVLRTRMEAKRRNRIPALTDELLDWIGSCRSPAVERLRKLSSPPALSREQAAMPPRFLRSEDKRALAMKAFIELALRYGYEDLTDPQIANAAGLTTEAFHKQFRTKEHCYLAVLDQFCTELNEVVARCAERGSCWTEGVRMGMRGYVEHIARHPDVSRLAFVELFGLGPAAASRQTAVTEAFTSFLVGTGAHPARAPMVALDALAGALWAVVGSSASSGRLRYLPSTLDHLTFTMLAPYTGPRPAIEAIEEAHSRANGGASASRRAPRPAASAGEVAGGDAAEVREALAEKGSPDRAPSSDQH